MNLFHQTVTNIYSVFSSKHVGLGAEDKKMNKNTAYSQVAYSSVGNYINNSNNSFTFMLSRKQGTLG